MNNTLNNLAILSFERKAKQMEAVVINKTKESCFNGSLNLGTVIKKGESIILWSQENGFQEINCSADEALVYAITFADKYKGDFIFHLGIYNSEEKTINVFRIYDQIQNGNDLHKYDLKFFVDDYLQTENFNIIEESELVFLQQGQGSYLSH